MSEPNHDAAAGPTIPASAAAYLRCQIGRKVNEPEDPEKPVYLLEGAKFKADTVYQASLSQRGFRYPNDRELLLAIVRGLESVHRRGEIPDDVFAEFQAVVQQQENLPPWDREKDGPQLPWGHLLHEAQWMELVRWGEEHVPRIKEIYEERKQFSEEWPRAVCRAVLRGVERSDVTVEVVGKEATDATLAQMTDEEIAGVSAYWLVMSRLTEAQKKTFASLPPSPETPTITPPASDAPLSDPATGRSRGTKRGTKSSRKTLAT